MKKRDILIGLSVLFIVIVLTLFGIKIKTLNNINTDLSNKITKKDAEISQYKTEQAERESLINEIMANNDSLQKTIENKDKALADKDKEIETYKTQIAELKKAKKTAGTITRTGDYYTIKARITSYCSCSKCCGKWAVGRPKDENGNDIVLTASGKRAVPKYTLGASTAYKFGTKVEIPGVGICEVMDRGSGVTSANHFDMYFSSHSEALKWHNKIYECKVYA